MTILELSAVYRSSAVLLRERMRMLRLEMRQSEDPSQAQILKRRIADLTPLYRECRETAAYLEHYYDGRRQSHGKH